MTGSRVCLNLGMGSEGVWIKYKNWNANDMANTVIKCIGLYGLCIKIGNGTCGLSITMGFGHVR